MSWHDALCVRQLAFRSHGRSGTKRIEWERKRAHLAGKEAHLGGDKRQEGRQAHCPLGHGQRNAHLLQDGLVPEPLYPAPCILHHHPTLFSRFRGTLWLCTRLSSCQLPCKQATGHRVGWPFPVSSISNQDHVAMQGSWQFLSTASAMKHLCLKCHRKVTLAG